MKRLILFCATMLATSFSFAQAPPVDSRCGGVPPGVTATELAQFVCNPATNEWVNRSVLKPSSIGEIAQATPPPATATPASAAPAEREKSPPGVGELVSDAGKVIDDWKNIGWLAGVIALINLLLNLIRFTPIETWLISLDYKWLKPLIATVLGAALGGFSTFSTGAGVFNSIVAGAIAGLGSVGFHELVDKTRKRTIKPAVEG